MTEEAKLLRALIDALGFEVVETVKEVPYTHYFPATIGPKNPETGLHITTPAVEIPSIKKEVEYSLRVKD